jgi:CDP-2,3-bis-(O-geranylgeranyl)-sn-glycerol synthase
VTAPDGFASAAWLVVALSLAGAAHVLWLKSRWGRRLSRPLDGGATFRGRRVFGANKQVRGVVVMPLASAGVFTALGGLRDGYPEWLARGLWDLPPAMYAGLGFACGLAFMLGELPNSFLKRQLDVAPGAAPQDGALRPLCFVIDRCDSTVGVLIVLTLLVPVSTGTWLWALLLGPASHAAFSTWLYRERLKARPL